MEALPHENLWAGSPESVPMGLVPVARAVCCGDCYPDNIECILPVLQMLIRVVARSTCAHGDHSNAMCASCALEVLAMAERCRNSTWWKSLSEEEEADQSFDVVREFSLVGDEEVAELVRTFDHDRWLTYGGDTYLADDVEPRVRPVSIELGHRMIDLLQLGTSLPWPRAEDRAPGSPAPSRSAYNRAEAAIAQQLGLSEPVRHTVEAAIRAAAVESLTEADFIRVAVQCGLKLIPFVDPAGPDVLAFSVVLTTLPTEARLEFGGKSLAHDLALSRLRATWGQFPDSGTDAWATWALHSGMQAARQVPSRRGDGLWRWIHPEAMSTAGAPQPASVPSTPHARRAAARVILQAGQAGWCAMCSIRYRHWRVLRAGQLNENAWLIAEGICLDHDHETGLIRGLLCDTCNHLREPVGAKAEEAVWRAYVTNPPAVDLGCSWLYE